MLVSRCFPSWLSYNQYFLPLLGSRPMGRDNLKHDPNMPDEDVTVDFLLDNGWIVGYPDYCISRIKQLYEEVGGFGTLLQLTQDWDDPRIGHRSIELFMRHVAPALDEL